jgi:hypothetical protein
LAKILLDDMDTATHANIFACGGSPGEIKSDGGTLRHEVKSRSAVHDKRWARVVREHEDGDVIHRVLAPPTPPALVRPWATNRPEHVSVKNPGSNILKAASGKIIINARFSAIVTEQVLLKCSGGDRPTMQRSTAHTQWMMDVLVRASTKTVER